jgi:hypothetical protein
MKAIAWLVIACACQQGKGDAPKPEASEGYRQDIANLCDVVQLSGADKLPPSDRDPTIAMWLGPHIKTSEGHEFLVSIHPLEGEPKARALEAEARRVGLPGCALAAEWRR